MAGLLKGGVALIMLALVATTQPMRVYACSCLPPGPPAEALANATAVFSGKVTALAPRANVGSSDPVRVTFAVARVWKGTEQGSIVLSTPGSSASCGVEFVQGREYLVYAQTSEGQLQASLCSRTTSLAAAGDDIAVLGEGKAPTVVGGQPGLPGILPDTGDQAGALSYLWLSAAAAGVLIAAGGLLCARRKAS